MIRKRKRKRNETPYIYSFSGWAAIVSYLLDIFDFDYILFLFLISFGALVYLVHIYTFFDYNINF